MAASDPRPEVPFQHSHRGFLSYWDAHPGVKSGQDLTLGERAADKLRNTIRGLLGQALHAETLSFAHPITQEKLSFSAPLPAHIISLVEAMQSQIKEYNLSTL